MDKVDILIIGAGVVGLAIVNELAEKDKHIIVVEKNKSFGQETSSRNSEVIHGGMYYPTGTLKARLCVEGRELLYELCQKNNIPHKKIGKLIVATEKEEIPDLEKLFAQGKNNGVNGLEIIGQEELKRMEPNIRGTAALYSPETGILDSHRLMEYFFTKAKENGALIAFNSEVTGIEKTSGGYRVSIKNDGEITAVEAETIINCAGLDSDTIAEMAGIDVEKPGYKLHYCKGQYFRLNNNKAGSIKHLVYPVPKPKSGGLGIHATLDLAGGMRLGPDDSYLENRDKDYSVDESKRTAFYASAKKFMPFLEESSLYPDTAGIRPKLHGSESNFRDFVIKDEAENGLPGCINLIGIESPGLTAAPAIARKVTSL